MGESAMPDNITRDLHALYDSVLGEPIPEDMLELLEKMGPLSSASVSGGNAQAVTRDPDTSAR